MSLETLTTKDTSPSSGKRRGLPAWLLPLGLLLGFAAVFLLLFGQKLLPAIEVRTAPVLTVRGAASSATAEPADPKNPKPKTQNPKSQLLFQASGWVEPDPYTTFVPVLINGVVKTVEVLEGQTVKKGQLLATLIDDDARLDLQQAEQKIASIQSRVKAHCAAIPLLHAKTAAAKKKIASEKARLQELEDRARRLESLPAGSVPRQEVVQARLQADRQKAALEEAQTLIPQIEAQLHQIDLERQSMNNTLKEAETERDRARLALDRTRITAPIDGIVLHLHAAPGKKRMLGMDDPKSSVIVELYDPRKLQARIDVPLSEAAALQAGQPVELVTDLLPGATFSGKVTRVTGEADLARNTLQAKVQIHDPDPRLRPEMLVRAKFYPAPKTEPSGSQTQTSGTRNPASASSKYLLFAPEAALINPAGETAQAWVVTPGSTAELRSLTLGPARKDGHLQVLTGLRSGEHLILPPHDQLKPDIRVKPIPNTQ